MSDKNEYKRTSIGGQAVIEGVMMRGPHKTVLAVRHLTSGEIITEDVAGFNKKPPKILRVPIIRGVYNFILSMIVGYKTLMRSADLSGMTELEEEEKQEKKHSHDSDGSAEKSEPKKLSGVLMSIVMGISAVLGIALAVVLFMWLPTWLFNLMSGGIKSAVGWEMANWRPLIEGIMKLIIFLSYLAIVSQMKDIKRVFKYHGAEHKTIFCYEHGLELTVENVRRQIRFHPRCGTSFMFLMIIVGILISTVIVLVFPHVADYTYVWVPVKILLVPLFCGIGYELIKFCGRHDNLLTRIIAAPGLWVQRLTTKEPDDDMIEVAIASMKPVIPENNEDDRW